MYRVIFEGANLIKMSLVTSAAMLAICLLALVETTNTAEAKDSLPENGKIAFLSGDGNIYTVEPDGSNLSVLSPSGGGAPKWSPDGTEIICPMCNASHSVIGHGSGDWPTYSADGTSVAVSEYRRLGGDYDIFMVDLATSKQTPLRRTPKLSETYVDFSPDGSQICFFNDDSDSGSSDLRGGKPMGVYVMDVKGSAPPRLLAEGSSGTCDWSPDGKKIVFNQYGAISIKNADGSGRTALLTGKSAANVHPAWSPDGTKIVFSSNRDGGDYDIYTMDADGSDVAQLTNLPGDDEHPDWQPLPGTTVNPPDTGGPSLILVASALLFSGGTLLYAGLRRSM